MPSFKKLISALCAAAMVSATFVVPVMAETTTYYDESFDDWTAASRFIQLSGPTSNTTSYADDGWEFYIGSRADGGNGYVSIAGTGNQYIMTCNKYGTSSRNPRAVLTKAPAASDIENTLVSTFRFRIDNAGLSITLNDGDSTNMGTNQIKFDTSSMGLSTSQWYDATVAFTDPGKTAKVIVKSGDNIVYNQDYSTALSTISRIDFGYNVDIESYTYLDDFTLKDEVVLIPEITAEELGNIEVGAQTTVATVTGYELIDINVSNNDFSCNEVDGVISVLPGDSITEKTSADITITATSGSLSVTKTITVTAVPLADFAKTIAESLALSGNSITDNGDNNYNVSGDFTVPTELSGATITWVAEGDGVTVNENTVAVDLEAGTAATLTATVDYKGFTATKVFNLTLTAYQEYYNESFDSWGSGMLVQLKSTPHSDTTSHEGWGFYIGSRSDGGSGIISVNTSGTDKYISANADYGDSNRNPYFVLTNAPKAKNVTGALVANFKLRVAGSIPVTLSDGAAGSTAIGANQVTINLASLGLNTGEWYDVTYAISKVGSEAALVIKDSKGDTVVTRTYTSTLTTVSRIDISYNARANMNADINDFVLYKTAKYTVPKIKTEDVDVLFAGNSQTVATVSEADSIDVELSDSQNFSYTVSEDGEVIVKANDNAKSGAATTVTITATADATVSAQTSITTLLAADVIDADKEKAVVLNYTADKGGKLLTFTPADGAVLFNDIVFPTTSDVEVYGKTYTVDVKWAVDNGNDYLSAKGAINVTDTDTHAVKLTRTATYEGAEPYVTTYNIKVQFDPKDVEAAVNAAAEEKNITGTDLDNYITAFVSEYQVKFDAACDDNFSDIPTSAKGGDKFDLPSEGVFGSTITWSSSSSDTIKVASSTNQATVKTPNSTKTVTLTATVKAGGAKSKTHTESVKVTGSSSSGGGSSSSGGSSRSGGSGSATSIAGGVSYNTTVTTPSGTTTLNPNPSGFDDLDSVSWALTAINNLYVNGVINGKTSTEFCPNDPITRAEFAKILVNAFNLSTVNANSATFYDVPLSHWASTYVETAAANGIIKGYDDGSFEPNTKISRQEMAVMVLRAAQAAGYSFTDKREAVAFNDASSIASYAKDAVDTLYKAGVVNGVDGNAFEPLSTSTRAQACQIIYNVFN